MPLQGVGSQRLADRMRGESAAKALIFLPMAISMVGAGVIWRFIYDKNRDIGLLNWVWVHLDGVLPGKQEPHLWLQDTSFFGINKIPGTNAAILHSRGPLDSSSTATRLQAAFSLLIWIAIIICGRWIAYV
mgnify:CR=1 FL=1